MKKTTVCNLVNLLLVAIIWASSGIAFIQLVNLSSTWLKIVVFVIVLPLSGYFVQYIVSPLVNRLIVGDVSRRSGE